METGGDLLRPSVENERIHQSSRSSFGPMGDPGEFRMNLCEMVRESGSVGLAVVEMSWFFMFNP